MCSDIEPETSIRQNITAWATGFGVVSKRRVPDVDRIDERNPAKLCLQRVDLRLQLDPARLVAVDEFRLEFRDRLRPPAAATTTRRAIASRTVRPTEIFAGEPDVA